MATSCRHPFCAITQNILVCNIVAFAYFYTMSAENRHRGRLDLVSMAISVICLVHCVALPLLMAVMPVVGSAVPGWPLLEWGTVVLTATVGGWAIGKGFFTLHRQWIIVAVFALGLTLVLVANLVGEATTEMALKGGGAVLLIWAHLRNRALGRRSARVLAPL